MFHTSQKPPKYVPENPPPGLQLRARGINPPGPELRTKWIHQVCSPEPSGSTRSAAPNQVDPPGQQLRTGWIHQVRSCRKGEDRINYRDLKARIAGKKSRDRFTRFRGENLELGFFLS